MQPLHPLHTLLLAGTVPVFLGALFSDIAYWRSFEIQWKNFASWSLVWGLVLGGLALVWAIVGLLHVGRRGSRSLLCIVLLFTAWLLAFVNVLVHAQDAWASMPAGLILSVLVGLLSIGAAWFGLSDPDRARAR